MNRSSCIFRCSFVAFVSVVITGLSQLSDAPQFDIRDEAGFKKAISPGASLKKLAGDMSFVEGPVWIPSEGGFLIFSDIPQNELKKWSPAGGLSVFRKPSQNANGNTLDRQGRLLSAEHSGRRVSITDKDGTTRTLVDSFQGRKFNSPNDVVVMSDGSVWFTDPDYGLQNKAARQQEGNFVYRYDPASKAVTLVAKDFDKPNGLCFSPDEARLFVADSGRPRHIRVFEVQKNGSLTGTKVFCTIDKGGPDGIRCDADGRVWSSAGDGVHIFSLEGHLIGKILTPETPANLCFGGPDGTTLFITARRSLYSLETLVKAPK